MIKTDNYYQNNFNNDNSNNNSNTISSETGKQKINKNAIYSIIFSIISIFIFWWLSLGGISCGILALKEIKNTNEKGKALAIIGIVIGVIGNIAMLYFEIVGE